MGKVITGFLVIAGLWVGAELFTKGPANAFGGVLSGFAPAAETAAPREERTTARRAGDAVNRAHDESAARRERMMRD